MSANLVYRPSASVIIAARNKPLETNSDAYNYKVLLFERSAATAFAKNHCVFPGGTLEAQIDESAEWLQYLLQCGITLADLQRLEVTAGQRPKLPLLQTRSNLSREITLRITAIRETFEEVGILMCCRPDELQTNTTFAQCVENFDTAAWQKRVHNDANAFLALCKTLHVVPLLWCLHEWSIWRSPANSNRKFETMYYFVAFKEQPSLQLEQTEVARALWQCPAAVLSMYQRQSLWLPPNLFYELSRLAKAHDLDELLEFAARRSDKGSTALTPLYYRCTNGLVATLPGDDFYDAQADTHKETSILPITVHAFRSKARNVHRWHITDMYNISIDMNIPALDEHISPHLLAASKL